MFKPDKKFFTILLGCLVVILIVFGVLRMKLGAFLPAVIDKNLPDAVIVAAIGIMLWNRQILNQEKREAEARKKAEEEAAAAGRGDPAAGEAGEAPSGDGRAE